MCLLLEILKIFTLFKLNLNKFLELSNQKALEIMKNFSIFFNEKFNVLQSFDVSITEVIKIKHEIFNILT